MTEQNPRGRALSKEETLFLRDDPVRSLLYLNQRDIFHCDKYAGYLAVPDVAKDAFHSRGNFLRMEAYRESYHLLIVNGIIYLISESQWHFHPKKNIWTYPLNPISQHAINALKESYEGLEVFELSPDCAVLTREQYEQLCR